jgi:MYXO-CTERM domain-containing protein
VDEQAECRPFVCDADACKTSCQDNADCADGFACNASADCVPAGARCVDGDTAAEDVNGQKRSCHPYFCAGGSCQSSCTQSTDCASGFVCDPAAHACVAASAASGTAAEDEGGCGCRTAGTPRQSAWWALVAGALSVAGLGARRQRRSRRTGKATR